MNTNDMEERIEDAKHNVKEKFNGVRSKINELENFVENAEPIDDGTVIEVRDSLMEQIEEATDAVIDCFDDVRRMRENEE